MVIFDKNNIFYSKKNLMFDKNKLFMDQDVKLSRTVKNGHIYELRFLIAVT